jgi:hypothetical protein
MSFIDEMLNNVKMATVKSRNRGDFEFDQAAQDASDIIQDEVYRAFGIPQRQTTIMIKDNVVFDMWLIDRVREGIREVASYMTPKDPRLTTMIIRLAPTSVYVEFVGAGKVDKFVARNIKRVQGVRNEGICFQIKIPQIKNMALSNAHTA